MSYQLLELNKGNNLYIGRRIIVLKPKIHEESNWTSHMIKYVCTAENCCPLEFIQENIHKRRPAYCLAICNLPILTGLIIVLVQSVKK